MSFNIDSKVGDLVDSPQAKVILDQHLPGFSTNPQIAMARGMSLKMVASFSSGKNTSEMLAAVDQV